VRSRWLRISATLPGFFDVLWHVTLSSYKGYLSRVQILELRVLSEPHERRHVLFDQQIGQLSSDDFDSGPWRTISASRRALCQPVTRGGSHPPMLSGSPKKAHKRWRA